MLRLEHLSVDYGPIHALADVSVDVQAGQFVAVVGPNGAGKTTLFKAISGQVAPSAGRIVFDGHDLLALPAKDRAHLGISHVPEGRQVFASLTVFENLDMGASTARGRTEWKRNLERCYALFPVLAERREQLAGTLSGGEQQMLAIARGRPGVVAAAVDARRAVDGSGADHRRPHLRAHRSAAPRRRADDPAGRAACGRSARALRPRLRAGCRAGRPPPT